MNDYIIDDSMILEREAEKILKNIFVEEQEKNFKLPYEEQQKVIDKYVNKSENNSERTTVRDSSFTDRYTYGHSGRHH